MEESNEPAPRQTGPDVAPPSHGPGATVWALRLARALTWLVYAFVVLVLIILGLGFLLLLLGASPTADFTEWIYRALARVMAPFRGMFEAVPLDGRSVLDVSVLFAMVVYGIVGLLLSSLINWLRMQLIAAERREY